jgi:hypothetical protein
MIDMPMARATMAEIERLRSDLELRNQTACDRKEIIQRLEAEIERLSAQNADAAAFLDNLATLMGFKTGHGYYDADVTTVVKWAAECRAMAAKLRERK